MTKNLFDTSRIVEEYEKRQAMSALARAICLKFNITPHDTSLVGSIGKLSNTNNLHAISAWVSEQNPNLDNRSLEETKTTLFLKFEDYWDNN